MRVVAAMTRTVDGRAVEVQAAHLLVNETRMLRDYRRRIALAAAAAFLSIALLGYLALRRGLRPLRAMAAQAARITPASLDQRLNLADTPHELREVAASFNAMLDRLADGYQRLTQFSADLAHEIRTPIGALMGNCQVALYQRRTPEDYESVPGVQPGRTGAACRGWWKTFCSGVRTTPNPPLDARAAGPAGGAAPAWRTISRATGGGARHPAAVPVRRARVPADAILFRRAARHTWWPTPMRYADADSTSSRCRPKLTADAVLVQVDNRGAPHPARTAAKAIRLLLPRRRLAQRRLRRRVAWALAHRTGPSCWRCTGSSARARIVLGRGHPTASRCAPPRPSRLPETSAPPGAMAPGAASARREVAIKLIIALPWLHRLTLYRFYTFYTVTLFPLGVRYLEKCIRADRGVLSLAFWRAQYPMRRGTEARARIARRFPQSTSGEVP